VTLTRALILVCSALALSACGSTKSAQPADGGQEATLPSPPIEAIDEPAPSVWPVDASDAAMTTTWTICYQDEATDHDCSPTPEHEELLRRIEGKKRTRSPLTSSEASVIARLRLQQRGANARLRLIAWKSKFGKLCLAHDETDQNGGSGAGPFGPCVPGKRCGAICLAFSPGESGLNTIAGVVSAKGDSIRITFDGGRVATYRLDGPLVRGFPAYRIFMLDLGRGFDTRLALFAGETLIAQEKRIDAELRPDRCDGPPIAPTPGGESRKSPLAKCLERAGAK
jgi:hypothetical protein